MKKIISFILVLFAFVMVGSRFIEADAFSGNVEVNITGIFDPEATGATFTDTVSYPYGSKVSMDLSGSPEGQSFAFWIVNGVVVDYPVDHQFTITNDMNLQVVFTPNEPTDRAVAVFIDVNGELLGHIYADKMIEELDVSGIPVPSRPGYTPITSPEQRFENILNSATIVELSENAVFVQKYTRDSYDEHEILVSGGSGQGFYLFNSIVTVTADAAPEGQKFSHWEEFGGLKVSAQETYVFSALYDRELEAIYVPEATVLDEEVIVTLSNDIEKRPGYHSYVGQIEVPEGLSVIEYGFFIGDEAIILDETNNSNVVQATNIHPITNEFVSSISIGSHMSVRAYVVVSDGETQTIVTSEANHRYIGGNYSEDFESLVENITYNTSPINIGGIDWVAKEVGYYSGDPNETASKMIRFKGANTAYLYTQDYLDYVSTFSFDSKYYNSSHTTSLMTVSYMHHGDVDWTLLETITLGDTLTGNTIVINKVNVRLRIDVTVKSANVDNIVIEGLYKGLVHDVIFDENNGGINNQLAVDDQTTKFYIPLKTGYTFVDWYTTPDFSGVPYDFNTPVIEDINLFAKWEINDYTISFESNGGSEVTAIAQDYNTSVSAPTSPTKTGYTFDGWYSDVELTQAYTFTNMPAENITLYAKWNINQYTITFDSNGGSSVTAITQNYGTEVTAPADPTLTDYTFSGWFTDDDTFLNMYTFDTMPAENITLYAKWMSAASSATVTFDSNGGSAVDSQVVEVDGYATEPTPEPTKTGYTFVHWETAGAVEWLFESMEITEDITLYALWQINAYTITFNSNGGTEVTAITQNYGTEVTAPSDPTLTDYTFGGWFTDDDTFTNEYTFTTMPAENITLYAKWIGPVTVIASYSGSTINMGDGNNAAIIGLDPLIFNVVSTKRAVSPIHIGLNSVGQIRLYGSSDTNGNILTVSIDEAYIINQIEFVFGGTVGLALIKAGETELFNGSLTANSTVPYSDLNASQFSIQNKNSSTGQIYILSISITYSPVNP